jgi:hypothetical protein
MEFLFYRFVPLQEMMKFLFIVLLSLCMSLLSESAQAQCSICTRTAQQLGEKPAKGLNAGIIYLALTPLAIMGILGYSWWKKNNSNE